MNPIHLISRLASDRRQRRFPALLFPFLLALVAVSCGGGSTPAPGDDGNDLIDGDGGNDPACAMEGLKLIPFDATLESDHIALAAPDGVLKTVFVPWGVHTPVLTGHAGGKADMNWMGYYALDYGELTWLSGGDGAPCSAGDTCGVPEADLIARLPHYIAPTDGVRVNSVKLSWRGGVGYYGTPDQWGVLADACDGDFSLVYGHIRGISQGLRDKMVAAGYTDPWTCADDPECVGVELITGDPIVLDMGDTVATPQVFASEVDGHPGYFAGPSFAPQAPYAQIEFSVHSFDDTRPDTIVAWPSLLPENQQAQMQAILDAESSKPGSFVYSQKPDLTWLWKSEMKLFNYDSNNSYTDYSSIFGGLGSWGEVDDLDNETCELTYAAECDDHFVIFPIQKETIHYDPANYHSANSSYIAFKYNYHDHLLGQSMIWGEVIAPAALDDLSGSMLIKWRIRAEQPYVKYQGAKYHLDPAGEMLRIRWTGDYEQEVDAASALDTLSPVTSSDACMGTDNEGDAKCYRRTPTRGFPGL